MLGRFFRIEEKLKGRSGHLGSGATTSRTTERPKKQEADVGTMTVTTQEFENLEEARRLVRDLRQKNRIQAQQILAWRRAFKMQEIFIARIQREKTEQLKFLSAKLLLFQSRLIRKQKDISSMLMLRENIIQRQKIIIENLTTRLTDNGLDIPNGEIMDIDTTLPDLDSLNDSDSAVVMEDIDSDSTFNFPKFRPNGDPVTVMRSVSDAIDPYLKYTSIRRNNGFLRRPEILETVYSVEEDTEENADGNQTDADKKRDAFANRGKSTANIEEEEQDRSVDEKIEVSTYEKNEDLDDEKPKPNPVKTYNRVMSNHRSVTKPKDVKYKRINKAKSKSLEELRGRLKNWVEQGSKITGLSLEHSQSCA